MPIPLSEKNVGQLSPIFYDRASPGLAMFIAESLKVPLRIFGSGHLIRWHHLSPKHIRDLRELEAKIKKINLNKLSNKTEDLSKHLAFLSQSDCFSLSAKVTLLEEQSLDCS